MTALVGLKAQLKRELKKHGIKTVELDSGRRIKLQNAKIVDLFKATQKL